MDPDVVSGTDFEALEFAYDVFWTNYGDNLVDITHLYPEWKMHEEALVCGHEAPEQPFFGHQRHLPVPRDAASYFATLLPRHFLM